ncbi:Gfo/Idh/MocA family protein [Aciditerrimonas ferrireducens]|jgi:1,5-anhydro-D-fructose reductase (1,5-anhydro-D-mannitol-forming)|uniref:Gfo/Idh/MocA family protein n=1 Tax=Aciditerrimonas ferrireducens TaxID=667306 RepID=A0ABV6C1G3_9ACTN
MAEHTFRWGVLGTGRIADQEIAPAITSLPGHELAGVVSREHDRAAAFLKRHHSDGRACTSLEELLEKVPLDAVYVATPNALHAEQVRAAAAAGRHVLCDKPLATTVTDAEAAMAACQDHGVRLGLMFQTRRFGGMARAKQAVDQGELGRVVLAEVTMSAGRNLPKGWRTDPAMAGLGTINNIGVHAFDLLRFLLADEVAEVTALVERESGIAVDTAATVLLRFRRGALAYVNANQAVPCSRDDLVLYGTDGRLLGANLTRPNRKGTLQFTAADGDGWAEEAETANGYRDTIAAFAEAVREGRDPSPGGHDGLASVRLTAAIARSVEEGRTVQVAP